MNIGDEVTVPDGRTGVLLRLENNVATVGFIVNSYAYSVAFNESDVQPATVAQKNL